jgi:hypothetical protein
MTHLKTFVVMSMSNSPGRKQVESGIPAVKDNRKVDANMATISGG